MDLGRKASFAAWKVARAATATPLYFKPLEIGLDNEEANHRSTIRLPQRHRTGGLNEQQDPTKGKIQAMKTALLSDAGFSRANNPSMNVLEELRRSFRDGPKRIANFVSIGTARSFSPPGISSTLTSILKRATSELGDPAGEHERMAELREFDYYRLDEPNALPGIDVDDWKPRRSPDSGAETIGVMKTAFRRWAVDINNQTLVRQAARSLVKIRRARTSDISMWERFALGRLFFCPARDCYLDPDETWHYRDPFIQHLQTVHGYNEDQVKEAVGRCHRDWEYKSPGAQS